MMPLPLTETVALLAYLVTAGLLVHSYAGYPILMRLAGRWLLPAATWNPRPLGDTMLLVAVHNEEQVIEEKLRNALSLAPGHLQIVIVSDGSTDRTEAIVESVVRSSTRVRLIRVQERRGKNHALNQALRELAPSGDTVVVFSDANAMFHADAILRLRTRLEEGAACVVGKLVFTNATTGTARAEGLYWRYENALKAAEGAVGRLPVANGAIFGTTADAIGELPADIANDFWIPISALADRRAVIYEPAAVAWEPAPQSASEEFARKVRMGNRQMRGVMRAWPLVDWATRFQLISHKVVRWFGIPLLIIGSIAAGILWDVHGWFQASLAVFLSPFVLGGLGLLGRRAGLHSRVTDLGAHFLLVHYAALRGAASALRGKHYMTWRQAQSSRAGGDDAARAPTDGTVALPDPGRGTPSRAPGVPPDDG